MNRSLVEPGGRMRINLNGATALGVSMLAVMVTGQAFAQQADAPPPSTQTFAPRDTAKGTARSEGTSAAPPSLAAGTYDMKNGLSFLLNYTGEFAANPSGGQKPGGNAFAGQLFIGADADFGKIANIQGLSGHFIFTDRQGTSLSSRYIGNDTSVQEIYGAGQTYRLTLLTLEQRLFNDHLDIEAGRTQAQGAFMISPLYCDFQNNATCGSPSTVFVDTNFNFFPDSTWGGHAKVWLDPNYHFFLHGGVYEVNPHSLLESDHGFDFSTRDATGVVAPIELGYSSAGTPGTLPTNVGVGVIIDTSRYQDPVLDIMGGASAGSGLPSLTESGRTLAFARFDRMIWQQDPLTPTRGISIFGVGIVAPDSQHQVQSYYAEGGVVWTGPLKSRPYDTLGYVISDQHYSAAGLFDLRANALMQGINPAIFKSDQYLMELNYGFQAGPAIRITPNLQYIVNPTNTGAPYLTKPIPNAFVVGAKVSVDLFTLAGLAKGPGSL